MSQVSPAVLSPGRVGEPAKSADARVANPQKSGGIGAIWLGVSRNRIRFSQLIFGGTMLVEILLLRSRPRDVLAIGDCLTLLAELAVLLGLTIRSWAAGTLHKQRQLTRTGPYALVRHPLYFGSFLMMAGMLILTNSLLAIVVLLISIPILYSAAIRDEEEVLAGIFPEEWPSYQNQTPRFWPRLGIWPEARHWSAAQWLRNHEHQTLLGTLAALVGLWFWRQLM